MNQARELDGRFEFDGCSFLLLLAGFSPTYVVRHIREFWP
jgi:hypothetical protein